MRLRAISVPASTPSGTVKGNEAGISSRNRYPTIPAEAELLTRMENNRLACCRKMISRKSAEPKAALVEISRKIVRERRAIGRHFEEGGKGTSGGRAVSADCGSSSSSSNRTAGATTEQPTIKLAAPVSAIGAPLST